MGFFAALLSVFLLAGCAAAPTEPLPEPSVTVTETTETRPVEAPASTAAPVDPLDVILENLTIEERVGQLFLARCQDETAMKDVQQYHLGGFVLFGVDFENQTPDSLREKLAGYQSAARLPLLIAVDEEGGTVTRISRNPAFRESAFPSPRAAYSQGGISQALRNEDEKCSLLAALDINVNLGPVCDIATDSSSFMYQRSLGQDSEITSDFAARAVDIMDAYKIGSVLKHFPGYGNNADTHTGIALDSRTLAELESCDLLPFAAGIDAGCDGILVSHTIVEAMDPELPASLSPAVHGYLREQMGFSGVILTDDLVMDAITSAYGAGEAAVLAVLAGNDMLCSTDYATQYDAVLAAVLEGRIPFDTLNNAVKNVLAWKMDLGILS